MGKIAIVTGGNAGLGFAIAEKFCIHGITTYIIGRSEEKTRNACNKLGNMAIPIIFDLNNLAGIPKMIEEIAKKDNIDILVNNAGINMKKDFTEVKDEEFESIIKTNVQSVFVVSREVVKVMKKYKRGNIINISSMASQYGLPKVIAYSASKGAIESMTRAMAVELAPLGIRVNCIAPGFIKTNMSSKALDNDPERKNKVLGRTPMGILGEPSNIADAAYFLASEEASFVTGSILPVDGGNSIGF